MRRAEGQTLTLGKPPFDREGYVTPQPQRQDMGREAGEGDTAEPLTSRLPPPLPTQARPPGSGEPRRPFTALKAGVPGRRQLSTPGWGARWRAPTGRGPNFPRVPAHPGPGERKPRRARESGKPEGRCRARPWPCPRGGGGTARPAPAPGRSNRAPGGGAGLLAAPPPRGRGGGAGGVRAAAAPRSAGPGGAGPAHGPAWAMTPAALSCRLVAAAPGARQPPPPAPGRALHAAPQ